MAILTIPSSADGPQVVYPSLGLDGWTHDYVPDLEGLTDGDLFAALHDQIGSHNLTLTPATTQVHAHLETDSDEGTMVARQDAAPTGAQASVLENGGIDLGSSWSAVVVFKAPDAVTTTVATLDGMTLSRAANGSYTWGGNGTGNHTTAGGATSGWCVAVVGVNPGVASFFQLNGVDVSGGTVAALGSQTDRIYTHQRSTGARTTARDLARLAVRPGILDAGEKASVLAAVRGLYSFVPQS